MAVPLFDDLNAATEPVIDDSVEKLPELLPTYVRAIKRTGRCVCFEMDKSAQPIRQCQLGAANSTQAIRRGDIRRSVSNGDIETINKVHKNTDIFSILLKKCIISQKPYFCNEASARWSEF